MGHMGAIPRFAQLCIKRKKPHANTDMTEIPNLPALSDAQTLKLRLLSLLTIASSKTQSSNLTYNSLAAHLSLPSPIDLEHLVTQAIYSNLMAATLNPAAQTVVITSVSPLRDLAPGSVETMMAELEAWSQRCDSVLSELEAEIDKVKASAAKRRREEVRVERQIKGVMEAERGSGQGVLGRGGHNTRGALKGQDDGDDDDVMEIDGGAGRKRGGPGSAIQGMLGRFSGRSGGR